MKELEYTQQSVPKDKRFCTICGEVKRLHYFEGDSTHCSTCCEKMRHTRLRLWSVPVVVLMLLITAAGISLLSQTIPYCAEIHRADTAAAEKRLYDACMEYDDALAGADARSKALLPFVKNKTVPLFDTGTRAWEKYAAAYASAYSEYEAAELLNGALDKKQIAANPTFSALETARTAYDETVTFVQSLNEKYAFDTPEAMPYDKIIKELDDYAAGSDSRYVKGYTAYFKASAASFAKQDDPMAAAEYYDEMLRYVPDEYMTVYTAKGEAAMQAKAYDTAIKSYEAILEKNRNFTEGYVQIAKAAQAMGDSQRVRQALDALPQDDPSVYALRIRFALLEDDPAKAEQLRDEGKKKYGAAADTIFNEMLADQSIDRDRAQTLKNYIQFALYDAAVSLVKGDTDAAFKAGYEQAFNYAYYYGYISGDNSAITEQLCDMASICAGLAKKEDALQTISQVIPPDDVTQQVIDGVLSVRDVFVEGKADIL